MDIKIKDLEDNDIPQFLRLLNYLGDTSKLAVSDGKEILSGFLYLGNFRQTIIAVDWCTLVGTATLIFETKFIHNGGRVAHIEDVVVHPDWRDKGVGKMLVEELINRAKKSWVKPYKIILDCKMDNIPFYEKCGFYPHEICMRMDLQESKDA